MLHRYNDGSVLRLLKAKELITIPVWKGNRILDEAHATSIKLAIGPNVQRLDSGFSIIKYEEKNADGKAITVSYLIDGQHRASVIREFYRDNYCEPDFDTTVTELTVETESDAVEYFNKINNVKKQHWKTDPILLVSKYIVALEKKFNTNKKSPLIRIGSTHRPYMSSEKLREVLRANSALLKQSAEDVVAFVDRADKKNRELLGQFQIGIALPGTKDVKMKEKAIDLKFALAYDASLSWIREVLK